jgi:serine/threonine protein kinase
VHLLRDACHGLDYAHRAGVVHRDVKPGNLLVARETNTTKLADFGIAKAAEQTRITQVGAVLGTAAYLSPEQARGEEAGPASDIYSLGVCAYQFLTGRLPHEYSSLTELALKQQESAVQPITELRPDVPPELDDAVRLCLERDPENRYGSALELGRALEAGLRGESTQATRRLILSETDATRALAATDITSSTRAMPRTSHAAPAPTAEPAYSPTTAPPARRDAQRAGRRRQTGSLFALALVLAAVAAVAIALLASSGGSKNNVQAPDANDVQQQIDELRDFIGEHSR